MRWNANLQRSERTRHNFRSGQTLRARHRQRWQTMVEHREKRWSNASSRGIESDRSILWFTPVTQPSLKVERGCTVCPASARMPVPAATSQPRRKAGLADPRGIRARTSKGVRVRGPGYRRCESTLRYSFTEQRCSMEPASSRSRRTPQKRTSRRTPRPHGRREDPQPPGWTASDEEAGAERSEALSRELRTASTELGRPGCWRTACATHPPREQSRGRRTSKGTKAQGG